MSIDDQSDIQQYAMVGPKPAVGSYFNWRQDHIANRHGRTGKRRPMTCAPSRPARLSWAVSPWPSRCT